jgi:hypothetical protein
MFKKIKFCVLFEVFGVFYSPFDLRDGLQLVWVHRLLPIGRQMVQFCPTKHTPFLSGRGDATQWAFKLNSPVATAVTHHLRDCGLKVNWKCWLLQSEECLSVCTLS